MSKNATEAKRAILAARPGKEFDLLNASVDIVNAEYASHMAKAHPEVHLDGLDSFALGEYAARQAHERQG